ncbi:MAG TPA: hypothetical protein VFI29_06985 [Hanamia sp.]|nr:hypothetical protein [Hanamia sp.]
MSNHNQLPEEEKFSNDPEENLRMQNDFLKMKMMLESGARFGGNDGELPPEIENEWLKNIMEFEKANADSKAAKIFDLLGKPFFEDELNLNEKIFKNEFSRLQKLLKNHGIKVEFNRERNDRFKYHFITKELFDHATTFMPVKGMTTYFLYEEFQPDHELDIKNLTGQFLNDYFEKKLDEDSSYIGNHFVEPNGNVLSKEELMKQFLAAYDVFMKIENTSFTIENIDFELNEESVDGQQGMGFSEGEIRYDIVFKGGELKKIFGPFKIYFSLRWDCWEICFFYLAGFNYHPSNE